MRSRRTSALPQITPLRRLLLAGFPVYAVRTEKEEEIATAGISDARSGRNSTPIQPQVQDSLERQRIPKHGEGRLAGRLGSDAATDHLGFAHNRHLLLCLSNPRHIVLGLTASCTLGQVTERNSEKILRLPRRNWHAFCEVLFVQREVRRH